MAGRLEQAEEHLRRALEFDPESADAYNNLGGVQLAGERWQEAAASLQRAVEFAPGMARAHANLGYAWLQLGQGRKAEASLRRALEIDPGLTLARSRLEALQAAGKRAEPTGRPEPVSRIP